MTPSVPAPATRVGFNLLWLVPSGVGGSEEATVNAIRALDDCGDGSVEVVLFGTSALRTAYPDLADRFPFEVVDVDSSNRLRRIWAENTALGRSLRGHDLDLVHHGGGTIPFRSDLPVTVTIHDVQPLDMPRNFGAPKRHYLAAALRFAARRAAAVAVPSEFVADRVVDRLGTGRDRVHVVPWCAPPRVRDARPPSREERDTPYFLYPAVTWQHKNHSFLIEVFEAVAQRCDADLVLTGSAGPAHDAVMARVAASPAADRIHHLGRVARATLDDLMAGAVALTFPSTYEGFGMPVVEAASMGVPLVVSTCGSLPELVTPGCRVLDPNDAAAWCDAMVDVAVDGPTRAMMSAASTDAARRFSPALTARGYRDMWRLVHTGTT